MSFPRFPNQPEPKEKYGFEISYIFSENISRVWNCLKNIPLISVIEPSFLSQVYLIKGKNTWTEGSEFKGYWVGVSYLSGKCVKVDNSPNTKTISWVMVFLIVGGIMPISSYFIEFLRLCSMNSTVYNGPKPNSCQQRNE